MGYFCQRTFFFRAHAREREGERRRKEEGTCHAGTIACCERSPTSLFRRHTLHLAGCAASTRRFAVACSYLTMSKTLSKTIYRRHGSHTRTPEQPALQPKGIPVISPRPNRQPKQGHPNQQQESAPEELSVFDTKSTPFSLSDGVRLPSPTSSRVRREIDISTSHSSTIAPSRANESVDFQQAQFVHVPPPPLLNLPTVTLERAGSRDEVVVMDSETTAGSHRRELRGPKMRFLSRLIPSRLNQSHPGSLSQSLFEKDDERSHMSMRSKLSSWKTFSVFSQMVEKPRLESLREWSFSRIVVIDILRTRKQDLVCSARHTFSGEWAILKIVWKRRFRSKKADITRERRVWESVSDCQFVVGLKAYFKTPQCYCFVAEYYEGCTLQSLLEEGALRDDVIVNIVANVTYALKYIHDRDMMYRNISPTTILIDMTGIARLFDFAFCSVGKTSSSRVGSIPYMAPEVLRMEVYDRTSDYWSLGILAYVLYVRHTPMSIYSAKTNLDHWVDRDYMYQYAEVVPITLPKHMPPHAKSLISGLLVERPRLRLGCRSTGFYEVMKHPFFRHVDWDSFTRVKGLSGRNIPRGYQSL
ncbi:uncharacterized protein [Dermacentor andersoni]|uniref:uncharacterized protein isoform X3 n=1 Tax=Dermacentor andersoni TaxID=34620 RepID=UPI0024160931|nr:serine/threonine-protein kinase N2-like isoform X3 [Dermacentor andersoni]